MASAPLSYNEAAAEKTRQDMTGDEWKIPVERIKPILERAILDRNDEVAPGANPAEYGHSLGGQERVAMDIALSTGRSKSGISRQLWKIMNGHDAYTPKKPRDSSLDKPATEGQVRVMKINGIKFKEGLTALQAYNLMCEQPLRVPYTHMTFSSADEILTGLGLNHLWYTDLADIYLRGMD